MAISSKKVLHNFSNQISADPFIKINNPADTQVITAPLTSAQQGMWFAYELDPNNIAYNRPVGIKVKGALDLQTLEDSLNLIAQRQQVLRTTFKNQEGNLIQQISPAHNYSIQFTDYSSYTSTEAENRLEEFIQIQARHPFNLETGPLLRPFLIRIHKEEHLLFLVIHQIIFDYSSTGILLQELAAAYTSLMLHKPITLPQLPIQYGAYAHLQQEFIKQPIIKTQLEYWKKQLGGELPVLEIPIDRPRPAVSSFGGTNHFFKIGGNTTTQLKGIAERNEVSLYTTLLAAFYTLLYRYSAQEDIIIGTPVSTRNLGETDNLIGLFRNMLALRQQVIEGETFIELLYEVQRTLENAGSNQAVPFEKVVEEIIPDRTVSMPPVYQVLFSLNNAVATPRQTNNIYFEYQELRTGITNFDLFLEIITENNELSCVFEYDTDLFNEDTIERMEGHFRTLLESIIANPYLKISQLPIVPEFEKNLLINDWNRTQVPYPDTKCVHQLFEEQAEKTPGAIAIVFDETHLTYSQLNEKANQLAYYLQGKGVGPETMVGICVERSLELIIGLLGILKAGGAFVPLDTNYPKERLMFMLEDTGVTLLLTQKKLENYFSGSGVSQSILLDEDWQKIREEAITKPQSNVNIDNLLYVMYTSGSTGKPKGVSTLHRGVVRLVKNTNYVKLNEQEVLLQYAPVTFDASTFEIWGSLLNGGKLIIMPNGATTLEELKHCINKHKVTTLWLSAGLFHLMVDNGIEELTSLRQLLAGGEALSINHVRKVYQDLKNCKIINGYGPTENTTFTCCYEVTEKGLTRSSVPIGRPINNTTVYILDKYLNPVPLGVAGELYTGGAGLARNYLNRPDLTAEKFLPNPFAAEPNEFMYKTGDLVRYLPDGAIEFLGRIDTQVKIRGFRIELGEIEAVLGKHEQVKESVVVVREDIPGDKRIVAYVVTKDNSAIDAAALQNYLKKQMPAYMIPSGFVSLEYLPLTVNGKVNKKALPDPKQFTQIKDEYVAPETEAEQTLAYIWAQVLGQELVGTHDNFFEIGGHSLLAVKLVAAIRNKTGRELPVSVLYFNPTIATLAKHIEGETDASVWHSLIPIKTGNTKLPVYFIHHGGGTIEYAQRLAPFLDSDQPIYGLQPVGLNGIDQPLESIEQMADYYIELIIANQPEGPYHLGGYSTGGLVAYEIAKKLSVQGKSLGNVFIFDTYPTHVRYAYQDIGWLYILRSAVNLMTSITYLQEFYTQKRWSIIFRKANTLINILASDLHSIIGIRTKKQAQPEKHSSAAIVRMKFLALSGKAEKKYHLEAYPGTLVFIRAIENAAMYLRNCSFGWKKFARGGVSVYDVGGNHHTLFDDTANVKKIAGIVQKQLNEFYQTKSYFFTRQR